MVDYEIGTLVGVSGSTDFLWQTASAKHSNTKVTAADSDGNVACVAYHDDVLTVGIEAVFKAGDVVPQSGMVMVLTGIIAPTVDAVTSTFTISGTVTDTVSFYCENPTIKTKNTDWITYSCDCVRHLANGLPATVTT